MLPKITDLCWLERELDHVTLTWTNPAWLLEPDQSTNGSGPGAECRALNIVAYDIRVSELSLLKTEQQFLTATAVKFEKSGQSPSSNGAWAKLHADAQREHRLTIPFFTRMSPEAPKHLRSQFRERVRGHYAIRYKDESQGWSPISNVLWDDKAVGGQVIHQFDTRLGVSVGISNNVASTVVLCEIRDPYTAEIRRYSINANGLSIGAKFGATEGLDQSWTRFKPYRHMHVREFDRLGIHLLSQGVAFSRGISRSEIMIYDSLRDAAIQNRDALVAGPINFDWGLTKGYELNFLGKQVGTLDPLR